MEQILQILLPSSTVAGSSALNVTVLCIVVQLLRACNTMQIKVRQCSGAVCWSNLATLCGAIVVVLMSVWCSGAGNVCMALWWFWCVCVLQWWHWYLCGAVVALVSVRQNLGFLKSKSCFLADCCRPSLPWLPDYIK